MEKIKTTFEEKKEMKDKNKLDSIYESKRIETERREAIKAAMNEFIEKMRDLDASYTLATIENQIDRSDAQFGCSFGGNIDQCAYAIYRAMISNDEIRASVASAVFNHLAKKQNHG